MFKETVKRSANACVLVSGGVESAVLLADALSRYDQVTPIYVRNHLRWEDIELFSLKNFLRHLKQTNLKSLRILDLPMRELYEGHWSITGIKVPGAGSRDESMYLPGRNIVFLSKAAVFAASKNIPFIEIGVLRTQCLDRRIDNRKRLVSEIAAWERQRNSTRARIRWRCTAEKAREKMAHAYPSAAKES